MRRLGLVLALLLWAAPAWATTYYVRMDGNNGNAGTANTSGGAWLTIDYAADHVTAGDTVRVQAGTYAERVTPGVNGTSASAMVTFVADGAVTFCGMDFTNASYIRVVGFTMDTDTGACSLAMRVVAATGTNTGLEFWHNTFTNAYESGFAATNEDQRVHGSLFVGNSFSVFGISSYLGSGNGFYMPGNHNVVAYNTFFDINVDGANVEGSTYCRWLNNYLYDMDLDATAGHADAFQVGSSTIGWSRNLYEATLQIGLGSDADEHFGHMSNAQPDRCDGPCGAHDNNIFRRNVMHYIGSSTLDHGNPGDTAQPGSNTRYYHNTTADGNLANASGTASVYMLYSQNPSAFVYNNIEYDSWGTSETTPDVYVREYSATITADYNLGYDALGTVMGFTTLWNAQAHPQSNVNPWFVSYDTDDFTLGATSGAIGTAGPLTTTSGSGTGTTFNVATGGGGFFVGSNAANVPQYGGALVPGDTITVGTDVVTVASVSGDAITVAESFTWATGEPVYFGSDPTPDIGAYPYKAGGYALTATYASAGGTTTITPNDASLVRFAVCYSDGVPVTVDHSSPFTCATPSGTVSVRVYPLYASKTLWADATGVAPSAPTNVRIR